MTAGALAGVLAFLARLISGVNARWLDCPPDPRPRIYFANHTSHLDFVVLWSVLPDAVRARVRPVAGSDYWDRTPLRRYLVHRVFHAVLIDRPIGRHFLGRTFLDPLLNELDQGNSLIVFPEGTRGSGDEVGAFKAGLYHLCRLRPAVEAVPVYLENLNRILPKGEFLPVPLLSRATFGPPIAPAGDEEKAQFLERARAAVRGLRGA
jgi:1-acyl-sn-glycerol-3-phosphate acyltransferase